MAQSIDHGSHDNNKALVFGSQFVQRVRGDYKPKGDPRIVQRVRGDYKPKGDHRIVQRVRGDYKPKGDHRIVQRVRGDYKPKGDHRIDCFAKYFICTLFALLFIQRVFTILLALVPINGPDEGSRTLGIHIQL